MTSSKAVTLASILVGLLAGAAIAVTIDTVSVGNPGNAGELSGGGAGGYGFSRICGAVAYTYQIGKFEITTGQFTEFLNAVARSDTHGLYSPMMDSDPLWHGCGIKQNGTPGNYSYSVADDLANRPVNLINWASAVLYANWMHNGQLQDYASTLEGSYYLDPVSGWVRKPNATWVIPTEDEWYKAAYHKNDGVTDNYWDYPTSSDTINGNMANLLGPPIQTTDVGSFADYPSPYGTFDQGGNVAEWTETGGSFRVLRFLAAKDREELDTGWPGTPNLPTGFRLALVPEPATASLFCLLALAMLRRKPRG